MPQPNILVIMSDQLKATASHLYGNPFCETPSLARLADQGVLFQHAFTPHPLCVPARCALWTGQYPHTNGCRRNETLMPAGALHAFQLWRASGYRCGLIGKNHCFEQPADLALFDTWCEISHGGLGGARPNVGMDWFRPIEAINAAHAVRRNMPKSSPRFAYAASDFPLEDYATGLIAGQTVRYLEQHQAQHGDEPFALWVSIPDPHEPYEAPRRYYDAFYHGPLTLPPQRPGEMSGAPERNRVLYQILGHEDDDEADVRGALAAYYGMVRFLDDGVGQIMAALDGLGLRENTIVVFCADHGDLSGEHNMICKGGVFYDALTRIPLIVSWPGGGLPQGAVDDSLVSLLDVTPTLLRLQGLPIPRTMQGAPLPTVSAAGYRGAAPRDCAFSEYGAGGPPFTLEHLNALPEVTGRAALMRSLQWREAEGRRKMVRTREWKFVHDPMGDTDELYHLADDPWEITNLADDPNYADVRREMALRLADWSICTEGGPIPVPLPHPDKYRITGRG
jgi:arylsulfatase A-like enzyme